MASKVNVRFVVLLSVVLGVVFVGVAAMAAFVIYKSPEELALRAEEAAAEGDYKAASLLISKAVNKDPANDEYLERWGEYLTRKVPDTETEFRTDYGYLRDGVLRGITTVRTTDVDAHFDYLNEHFKGVLLSNGFSRAQWENIVNLTEMALKQFEIAGSDSTEWHRLRRFRGIAFVQIMAEGLELQEGQRELAREDLEKALAVDPSDVQAAKALSLWHFVDGRELGRRGETAEAEAARERGRAVLADALARNPDNPALAIPLLRLDLVGRFRDVNTGLEADTTAAERVARMQEVTEEFTAELNRIADMMLNADPDEINVRTIDEYHGVARLIDTRVADRMTQELLERVIERDPSNYDALMALAGLHESNGRFERALELRRQVTELPRMPVSLDGYRLLFAKRECHKKIAELALAIAGRGAVSSDDFDPEMLRVAREARDALAESVPQGHSALVFLDAKFAIADGDLNRAHALLVKYDELTDAPDVEHLRLLGDISARADMPGEALRAYDRILGVRPTDKTTHLKKAELLLRLDRYAEAQETYEGMLDFWPNDSELKRRLAYVRRLRGEETAEIGDPVVECILDAQAVARGNADELGDPGRAIGMIDECLASLGFDARLYSIKARLMASEGDVEAAVSMLREALAEHPDEESLRELASRLEASGDLEGMLALVDREGLDELSTLVSKATVCNRFEAFDRASEFIDRALEVAPGDARVVQLAFFRAIRENDLEEARRLERVAVENNVDRAGGAVFRAHRQLMEGDLQGAVLSLREAVSYGTATANVWRLKGELEARLGRGADAAASFQQAININPRDVTAILGYVSALRRLGETSKALDVARANRAVASSDPRFVDIWLELEAEAGDRTLAVRRREQWLGQEPERRENRLDLARLYVDSERWDDAKRLIDGLRARNVDLPLIRLEADYHARRGDLASARSVFEAYIDSIPPEERTAQPYLAYGQFLIDRDLVDEGVSVVRRSLEYAGDDAQRIELGIGDQLARVGRYEDALTTYRRALESTPDDSSAPVIKRMVESLVRLGRDAEAEEWIAKLGGEAQTDLSLLLMRAEILAERGEVSKARDLLNRAAGEHSESPIVYYRRASLNSSDPRFRADVMQDLQTALRLDPTYWPALRLRAALYIMEGDIEAALADLRTAVDAHPRQDALRDRLMRELILRDRVREAVTVADDAMKKRPGEYELAVRLGDVFSSLDHWKQASRYYAAAWKLSRTESVLERYAESLLNQDPPDIAGAERILKESGLSEQESAGVRLVRAKLSARRGDMRTAMQELIAVLDLLSPTRQVMSAWHDRMNEILGPTGAENVTRFLVQAQSAHQKNPWIALFLAQRLVQDDATRSQGMEALAQLVKHPGEEVRSAALRIRSVALYRNGEVDAAVEDMKAGLEIDPTEPELNNNLAFLLINELDRVEEALPYAERAAAANPLNVNILDTLGFVYMELGRLDEAGQSLNRALRLAESPSERATVLMRMASLRHRQGEALAALEMLDEVQALIDRYPELESYQDGLDELKAEVR